RATRSSGASDSPAAMAALLRFLDEMNERLRLRVGDFQARWTAPIAKDFKERRPLLYQIVLLTIGALIALAVSYVAGVLHLT
ncbi:MAG: hypothetical protein ABIO80_04875, partial [Sphingomicrobium sp.]